MRVGSIVQIVIIFVLITALIIGNAIVLEPQMESNITGLQAYFEEVLNFHPFAQSDDQLNLSRQGGQELSKQIIQEGSVLVKNNGVLPLDISAAGSVNVFGHASIDWVYGGSGSGQVLPENNNADENIDFLKALDLYQVSYNKSLTSMYERFAGAVGDNGGTINTGYSQFYRLTEPSITDTSYYSNDILNEAKSFSDTAFVVIGRHAGETEDPPRVQYKNKASTDTNRHYLEISTEEEELLKYVGETYENVIVIVNSTNTMELDFVDTIPGIDACLVVGATGTRAAEAIPSILYGEVSPSGRFTDTYAYDMSTNVNYKRTAADGIGHYLNASDVYPTGASSNAGVPSGNTIKRQAPAFIDYIEGIYLGYKWYETANVEGIWDDYSREIYDNNGQLKTVTGYDAVVQYPFGYGLSYTEFEWTVEGMTIPDGSEINRDSDIAIFVAVTNVGTVPGMDVVEVYLTAEYKPGEIEKSHVSLVGFGKTATINPGEKQILTIKVSVEDLVSYDAYDLNNNGNKGYELDSGKYELKLMTDSHNIKNVDFANGASDVPGVITYNVSNTINFLTDSVTGNPVTNKFTGEDAIDGVSLDGSDSGQDIGFISRASFPDPYDVEDVQDRDMAANVKEHNQYSQGAASAWDNATTDIFGSPVNNKAPVWNSAAGVLEYDGVNYADSLGSDGKSKVYMNNKITSLGLALGSDYNHPLWEAVLNQITLEEAVELVRAGNFGNAAINSVGKPKLTDHDGPAQVRSFNAGESRGTGFPCVTVLGQTWSQSLAYSFGINYGKEMGAQGIAMDGTYGFGANLHRSAWGGRNYEYFSEDGFLAGAMLAEQVRGLSNTGKYCYLKHLVLYETEHERDSMYTWCNEQALREIYLKPFKKAIQDGGCVGIMSSYNRIGNVWTGGSEALIQGVIRNELGFNGTVVTDYVDSWSTSYMSIEDAVRAGGDINLGQRNQSLDTGFDDSNRIQNQVKEVCHHVLYMFLNPLARNAEYNESDDVEQIVVGSVVEPWVWWKVVLVDLNILVGVGCAYWLYFIFRRNFGFF
ncbi:MAG: glycoside hydrolase family 3 C-terminal domain-containing protein [Clostridia bacterium]|nr:glycoside hydrolase family 3 C-terminal domain-containing protein [Clostridia bacterium]